MVNSRIKLIVERGLGTYWSRSTAEEIVNKHPWIPYFISEADKEEARQFIAENRANPTEAEAVAQKTAAHKLYEQLFGGDGLCVNASE